MPFVRSSDALRPFWFLAAVFAGLALASSLFAAETETRYLSGHGPEDAVPWDFFCTAGRNSGTWTKIRVPSCWEQEGFGTYYYGVWRRGKPDNDPEIPREQGKYRTEFDVPADWQGRVVRIVFEGVMTDTAVRVNGQSAGAIHQGGFYEFRYDITPLLKFGAKNLLEVDVSKESSNATVNRAERRGDFWTFGGIFRPVRLEALPRQFIDWTAIDARADGSFSAQVNFGSPASAAGEMRAVISGVDEKSSGAPLVAKFAAGATSAELRGKFDGVKPWTAETPNLYSVKFSLVGPGLWPAPSAETIDEARARGAALQSEHTLTQRFGFRTFEVRPRDGLYLNGTKITLKGICRHCFWPETGRTLSREQSYADARLIKEANMNAVRCTHYPPDAHFLEACDELGLYVLDELAGWQGSYDTPTGARLIGQIVRRDVNHPSILFWDNGNEGGWNTDNDGEFAKWDPQQRRVLHPWALHDNVNTKHYPKYDLVKQLAAGPDIFMPTEFLHGLYDGGIGAGFRDYWDVMGKSPTTAGGFFWVFADEGVVRTEKNGPFDALRAGRIDNSGNQAPDGIVGPHHEKEGSFFAVKEIWSPVQIHPADSSMITPDDLKNLSVENGFDFTNLDQCRFRWRLVEFSKNVYLGQGIRVGQVNERAHGEVSGPMVAPHGRGSIALEVPAPTTLGHEFIQIAAVAPDGHELWKSSWLYKQPGAWSGNTHVGFPPTPIQVREDDKWLQVGRARIDKSSGVLSQFAVSPTTMSSLAGPTVIAYRRADRVFAPISQGSALESFAWRRESETPDVVVEARFSGLLRSLTWRVTPGGLIGLNYEYALDADADIVGIAFDYPEANVKSKRWLGRGPYRIYRNRMGGGVLDVHELAYNDPIPGQTYAYPEFKGYFRDWQWITLTTTEGDITIENASGVPFLGLYAPHDGNPPMLTFPDTGIAFLDVIPAMGSKFATPDTTGPQGQTPHVSGVKRGSVVFRFDPKQGESVNH